LENIYLTQESSIPYIKIHAYLCQDERLLIVLNNCRYVRNNVLPKLVDSFRSNDYPISDKLKKVRGWCYCFTCLCYFIFADGSNSAFSKSLLLATNYSVFLIYLLYNYFKVESVVNLEGCYIWDIINLITTFFGISSIILICIDYR